MKVLNGSVMGWIRRFNDSR